MKLCKFLYVTAGMIFSFCFEKVCECYAIEMNTEEKIGLQASEEKIRVRCHIPGIYKLSAKTSKSKKISSILSYVNRRLVIELKAIKEECKCCLYNGEILSLKNTVDYYQIKNLDTLIFPFGEIDDSLLELSVNSNKKELEPVLPKEIIRIRCHIPGVYTTRTKASMSTKIYSILSYVNKRLATELKAIKDECKYCVYNGEVLFLRRTLHDYQVKDLDTLLFSFHEVDNGLLELSIDQEKIAREISKKRKFFDYMVADIKKKKLEIKPAKYTNKIHKEVQLMCNQDTQEHHETIISENIDKPSTDPLPMPW